MANKTLFASASNAAIANTTNEAGGRAYAFSAMHTLAQYAATGTFGQTFYASEAEQQTYSIGAHELENVLRSRIPGKKFVVVLDACHSGAFGHGAVTRDIGAFGFIRPLEATIASAGAVVISSCNIDFFKGGKR